MESVLAVHDAASALLLTTMIRVGEVNVQANVNRAGIPDASGVSKLKLAAVNMIGVRGLRAARAGRAVLSYGFEAEARVHDRVLLELIIHDHEIINDDSGKAALDWLKGKAGGGITGKVNKLAPPDLYKRLSEEAHGDPAPIYRLIAERGESLVIGPRRTEGSEISLLYAARS